MNIFFKILFKLITAITNKFLFLIDAIVANAFPDFASLITSFNGYVTKYLGNGFNWFFFMIPPKTASLIKFYLGLLVVFYTISISVHAVLKVIKVIKALKIW